MGIGKITGSTVGRMRKITRTFSNSATTLIVLWDFCVTHFPTILGLRDSRTQICVLVRLVTKHTKYTDKTLKKHMQEYADDLDVVKLFKTVVEDDDDED